MDHNFSEMETDRVSPVPFHHHPEVLLHLFQMVLTAFQHLKLLLNDKRNDDKSSFCINEKSGTSTSSCYDVYCTFLIMLIYRYLL